MWGTFWHRVVLMHSHSCETLLLAVPTISFIMCRGHVLRVGVRPKPYTHQYFALLQGQFCSWLSLPSLLYSAEGKYYCLWGAVRPKPYTLQSLIHSFIGNLPLTRASTQTFSLPLLGGFLRRVMFRNFPPLLSVPFFGAARVGAAVSLWLG